MTFLQIKTEHEVSCMSVSTVTHISQTHTDGYYTSQLCLSLTLSVCLQEKNPLFKSFESIITPVDVDHCILSCIAGV